jgi:hypothetical protein
MRKFFVTLVCVVVCATLAVPSAGALTVIRCGTKLKKSLTLDRNLLNCKGDGLVVAASNITIDLGGFMLGGDGKAGGAGIFLPDGFKRVRVTNGTIQKFDDGIRFRGSKSWGNAVEEVELAGNRQFGARFDETGNNRILESIVRSNGIGGVFVDTADRNNISENVITNKAGITVVGDGTRIERNEVSTRRSTSVPGSMRILGDDSTIRRNEVIGGSNGVAIAGDENVVDRNDLGSGGRNGLVVLGNGNVISGNDVVLFSARGIWLAKSDGERDNVLDSNDVVKNKLDGILVDSRTSRIVKNDSSSNGGDGFDINGDHTLVSDNDAESTRGWGVTADGAGVQGSGNDVEKNGRGCRPARLCA